MHDGIHSKLISDAPATQKLKCFKLVEAAVRTEEKCTNDAKATTFIPRTPWKLKPLVAKLADLGFEFPNDSKHECAHDEDEDVPSAKDVIEGDLMELLEALSCYTTVVSEEEKKSLLPEWKEGTPDGGL